MGKNGLIGWEECLGSPRWGAQRREWRPASTRPWLRT